MKTFYRILAAALLILSADLKADPNPFVVPVSFPATVVSGLTNYKNSYFSVIYANGNLPSLSISDSGDQVHLNQIYKILPDQLITADNLMIPPQLILWTGTAKPNLLVLVVHQTPDFHWTNNSEPQPILSLGIQTKGSNQFITVSSISFQTLRSLENNNGVAQYGFDSTFSFFENESVFTHEGFGRPATPIVLPLPN